MKSFKRTGSLFLMIIIASQCDVASATKTTTTTTTNFETFEPLSNNNFASDLFSVIVEGKSSINIIYSPASIQTCMALAFLGAEGETAEELLQVLRLGEDNKIKIAKKFSKFLKTDLRTYNKTDEFPKLNIANLLYVNDKLKVLRDFNEIAIEYFETRAEEVNFNDSKTVTENANQWIAQQTENKIKNLLTEDAINSNTNALFINAIYFKAKWLNPFSQYSTTISKFYINLNDTKETEIMYNEGYYGYVELPEFEATALELPYNNSDISMLIVLPNHIEGLENLELKLRNRDLNDITNKMVIKNVHVYLPKFRIEYDMDLKEPLKKMGLVTTFTSNANFKSLFTTPDIQSISDIKHKAFLDVNESGSEAAAATFVTLTNLSGSFDEPIFRADHPFIFAIRSATAVYFAGHVATT